MLKSTCVGLHVFSTYLPVVMLLELFYCAMYICRYTHDKRYDKALYIYLK